MMKIELTKEVSDRLTIVGAITKIVEEIDHDLLEIMAEIVFDEEDKNLGLGIADLKAIIKNAITDQMERVTGLSLRYDQDDEEEE